MKEGRDWRDYAAMAVLAFLLWWYGTRAWEAIKPGLFAIGRLP